MVLALTEAGNVNIDKRHLSCDRLSNLRSKEECREE